jgi:hypothetical protein
VIPAPPVPWTEKHSFQVVDCATGETIARFTNIGAAYATAKSLAREYRRGLDVVQAGTKLSHCETVRPSQELLEGETLP